MSARRGAARAAIVVSIVGLAVAIGGFVTALALNAFVFDEYDAYGKVPIPGTGSLHLPAGDVNVSFNTQVVGGNGGGLPIPPLSLSLVPPQGVPDPVVVEDIGGGSTQVNSDVRARVWVAQIPAEGTYEIVTEGAVGGYINPQLAFGHGSPYGWVVWPFVGLFVVAGIGLAASIRWSIKIARAPRPYLPVHPSGVQASPPPWAPPPPPAGRPYGQTDDGARVERLKTLAALRDSGALTETEFQAEKRRLLDGL